METTTQKKPRLAFFTLRALAAFLLFGLLLGVLYWLGFNGYRNVAEWGAPGDHSTLIYEEETYELLGMLGKDGLTEKKYPIDKVLGQVKDDGLPKLTEALTEEPTDEEFEEDLEEEPDVTESAEIESETEPVTVIPPAGAQYFESMPEHAYVLYSVKDMEDHLLVLEPDGHYYLYRLVEESTSAETE